MVTCPDGHRSSTDDYCEVCGVPIAADPIAAPIPACPNCGAPSEGRFCEECGHDSALPAPTGAPQRAAPVQDSAVSNAGAPDSGVPGRDGAVVWVATIVADREFYDRMRARKGPDAETVDFPAFYPDRRIVLRSKDILIGKRSVSQGVRPDIDLGLSPADIGVSRTHAVLRIDGDEVTVTDLGSTNGTSLNGSDDPIPADRPVPLHSGDRIHVGGWTTITLTAEPH
ncbi:FHA domain-containing protein [Nocardia uniformis]|uniref:FHA domain-containing protein n=1 Tax=Nocardia uniformis TaxID=53432 RepID=A0A849C9X9_9NOCA|nr:FHA domain-containing protein [Nocardia uniformis]NNH73170.1 FHA domain-containing protein [Nocardia uniformis]